MNWMLRLLSIGILFVSMTGISFAEEIIVQVLNVGQADAILVTGAGKRVLIDAGEVSKDKDGEIQTVATQLKNMGISSLDMVFATHPHADHIGGMQGVLESFPIKAYVDNGFAHTSTMYENLMIAAENKVSNEGMRYMVARKGQTFKLGTEARFEILAPVDDKGITGTRSDINVNSIIMRLVHGDNCFLFMGDAEAEAEQLVAPYVGKCPIVKVSHHGSPHSSVDALLDAVQPEVALISCGVANKHGHPGANTVENFTKRGAKVYRTDWMGEIKVVSNGKTYAVTTDHEVDFSTLPCINVNTATAADYAVLKGVGKTTTDKIDEARANHPANYSSVDEFIASLNSVSQDAGHRMSKLTDYLSIDCSTRGIDANAYGLAAPLAPTAPGMTNINVATAAQLQAMGLSDKMAALAIEDRNANGPFKSCKDITRVKGIGDGTYKKIADKCVADAPVAIAAPAPVVAPAAPVVAPATPAANGLINPNTATLAQLQNMGLSDKMAALAIEDREANGPFKSCKDITRVKGIGDGTYKKIADKCSTDAVAPVAAPAAGDAPAPVSADGRINANTATAAQFQAMGLSAKQADSAVADRNANGPFKSCQDLKRIKGIGDGTIKKIVDNCTVN